MTALHCCFGLSSILLTVNALHITDATSDSLHSTSVHIIMLRLQTCNKLEGVVHGSKFTFGAVCEHLPLSVWYSPNHEYLYPPTRHTTQYFYRGLSTFCFIANLKYMYIHRCLSCVSLQQYRTCVVDFLGLGIAFLYHLCIPHSFTCLLSYSFNHLCNLLTILVQVSSNATSSQHMQVTSSEETKSRTCVVSPQASPPHLPSTA